MGFVGVFENGIDTGALPPLPKGRGTKPCLVVGYRKRSNAVFSSVLSLCIYPPTANAVPPPLGKEGNAGSRHVYEGNGKYADYILYDREKLHNGNIIQGPAIIEQMDSTTIVLSNQKATVDAFLNMMIERK